MNVWATVLKNIANGETCALVSIIATKGSVPRGTDAHMIITPQGYHGSIGGGTLEWKLMAEAQAMLPHPETARITSMVLGPDLGQCCGGRIEASIEVFSTASLPMIQDYAQRETAGIFEINRKIANRDITQVFGEHRSTFYLFGAGHVGRALVLALAPLPFDVTWIDPRPNAFPAAVPTNVNLIQADDAVSLAAHAPNGSFAMVMSHSHALDLAIVDAALRNPNMVEVGLIGSQTKRARFEKRLAEAGVDPKRIAALQCPIGVGGITSKHPAAIAAASVAQLLQWQSQHQSASEISLKQNVG
jgi:xanthine dehydrogenase accessory factor